MGRVRPGIVARSRTPARPRNSWVAIENVYVIDNALNELYVAEFGGTEASSVEAQERFFS